mgnify:CR=1 FL=1
MPLRYYGGKAFLAPTLLALLPMHTTYCEVFGGTGNLLFVKTPSKLEIFNDIDNNITNFFTVIKNQELFEQFIDNLNFVVYGREQLKLALVDCTDNNIEKAVNWFIITQQSFNGLKNAGWSTGLFNNRGLEFYNKIKYTHHIHQRLRNVMVENKDFRSLIPSYDSPETLFYLDPPYTGPLRISKNRYQYEMTEEDHQALVQLLLKVQGMSILSGYKNTIYTELEDVGWKRIDIEVPIRASNTKYTKQIRQGVESIWLSPSAQQQPKQQPLL